MNARVKTLVLALGLAAASATASTASAQSMNPTGRYFALNADGSIAHQLGTWEDFGDRLRMYPGGGNFFADINSTPDDMQVDPSTGMPTSLTFHWTMYDTLNSPDSQNWRAIYYGTMFIDVTAIAPGATGVATWMTTTHQSIDGTNWVPTNAAPSPVFFTE